MKRLTIHQGIAVFVAVPVVFFVFLSFNFFGIFGGSRDLTQGSASATVFDDGAFPTDAVVINDKIIGTGLPAQAGSLLTVHYVGQLTDGSVFDSSAERGPFQFTLGAGRVISGWDQGLLGMREGGRRTLIIPPSLAYGTQGIGPIPGNATLIFEVELLKVQNP